MECQNSRNRAKIAFSYFLIFDKVRHFLMFKVIISAFIGTYSLNYITELVKISETFLLQKFPREDKNELEKH
jgi:hypothetical protein